MNEELEQIADNATENAVTFTEVAECSPVEDSSGIGTLIWAGAKLATLVGGASFLGVKVSQKIYQNKCAKKGTNPEIRKHWYQVWRKKAKKAIITPVEESTTEETEEESAPGEK